MRPTQLKKFLVFAVKNKEPVLIKGAPGIGKTDIVIQVAKELNTDLIISHPVVSDPTDYKGLPFPNKEGTEAHFLPFGDLNRLISADRPTVFFLDDIGQAQPSVQASLMQLVLTRQINGHKVSDHVVFIAATNRREDKAGVSGILEPLKSRFASIVELVPVTDDWIEWAAANDMPTTLTSFIRYRPELLHKFEATKEIENSPSPRTIAAVGRLTNKKLPVELQREVFAGAAGEGFAIEYLAFVKLMSTLKYAEDILKNPETAEIPQELSNLYATLASLILKTNEKNVDHVYKFIQRLDMELQVYFFKDLSSRNPKVKNTNTLKEWAVKAYDVCYD